MEKYFDVLRKCSLFNNIEDKNLNGILACLGAEVSGYKKGEIIIAEGNNAKYIGIILFGAAQIEQVDYFGNRNIVANVEVAELFGESFACAGVESVPMDVVAKEDTEVLLIDCLRITQTCSNACEFHRQMIYNLMKIVATKNLICHQFFTGSPLGNNFDFLMKYKILCCNNFHQIINHLTMKFTSITTSLSYSQTIY